MKRIRSFPVSIVKSVSSQYNKSFHAKIFTLFASSESEVYSFSKFDTPHYNFCFAFMENDEGNWFLDNKSIMRIRRWVLGQGYDRIKKLYDDWKTYWRKYTALSRSLDSIKIKGLSDDKLYTKLKAFYDLYLKVGSIAYIADSFMSTGEEDWLENILLKEIKDKEAIRALIYHPSFVIQAEKKLINIIKKHSGIPKYEDIENDLERVERKYHWIHNNYYHVHRITSREFYRMMKKLKVKETRKRKKVKLSRKTDEIVRIAQSFAKWKDERKSGVYIGMYHFDRFISEISSRVGISKLRLNHLVFYEIEQLLQKKLTIGKANDIITRRMKRCFFAVTPKGYYITEGKDADKYFKYRSAQIGELSEIKGVVAVKGMVKGKVRVIKKTSDMKHFKKGEILVTNQTTPEFLPIMKKAKAIITEQGGITSHAAIVSRELNVPCIIGTKIATSLLKTGDSVLVDAIKGEVKIIATKKE